MYTRKIVNVVCNVNLLDKLNVKYSGGQSLRPLRS